MKQIGSEHLKFDDKGNFKGLYTISAQKAKDMYGKKKFWEGVDHIIRDYSRVNPGEINFQRLENKLTRDTNNNAFGSNESGTFRHALQIPYGLYSVLEEYDDQLFRDRVKLHKFMKLYPIFNACNVT